MDQLLVGLIGKPKLNPSGRLISLIAQNFSMLEDQAKFLKATFAIPTEKQLPLNDIQKVLIQIGPLHRDLQHQLEKAGWSLLICDDLIEGNVRSDKTFVESLARELSRISTNRSLIYVNDASQIQLSLGDLKRWRDFLRLLHKWRYSDRHFVVVLYQHSMPVCSESTPYLRHLEYISDGYLTTKSFKSCYLQSMWFKSVDRTIRTLISPRVETCYFTCKIGKSYWSNDLLCFYERTQVSKGFDPDHSETLKGGDLLSGSKIDDNKPDDTLENALHRVGLDGEEDQSDLKTNTLPYIRAQNPEQSRIFYYPDKDDDVDEDDPDDDLGI